MLHVSVSAYKQGRSRTEEWSDLPKGLVGEGLVCVPEGGVTVVECAISTRVDGDVLKVFWSYFSEVGFIKVPCDNKSCIWVRGFLLTYIPVSSLSAWSVLAWGGDITAVIMIAVNSLGSQNGRHRSVWNSRSGEQKDLIECMFFHYTMSCWCRSKHPRLCFSCELFRSVRAVHGEARELDGWVWNHRRHPGFCEANNTAVPCFSLVWDPRPAVHRVCYPVTERWPVKWLKRRSESTASQSDENASSFPSSLVSASAASPRFRNPHKELWCRVHEQSTGIQKLKVRFALRDGGTNVQKRVSI